MSSFPQFRVNAVSEPDGARVLIGSLDRVQQGNENWVGDGHIGSLFDGEVVVFGRWAAVGKMWRFTLDDDDAEKLPLCEGDTVSVLDGYWGERVWLVFDRSIEWKAVEFVATGNRTHDHCGICWATICETDNRHYYKGDDRFPVCPHCFDRHVQRQDISFVTST